MSRPSSLRLAFRDTTDSATDRRFRPDLLRLEDRLTPAAAVTIDSAAGLIRELRLVGPGESETIQLTPDIYRFTSADNHYYGANALPPITGHIAILGKGATLVANGTMRFFYVSGGPALSGNLHAGSLELRDLTLQGGTAKGGDSKAGGGGLGAGGAILNQGDLSLERVTLSDNSAKGGNTGVADSKVGNGGGGMGANADAKGDGGGFGLPPNGGFGGALGDGAYGGVNGDAGGFGGGGFANYRGDTDPKYLDDLDFAKASGELGGGRVAHDGVSFGGSGGDLSSVNADGIVGGFGSGRDGGGGGAGHSGDKATAEGGPGGAFGSGGFDGENAGGGGGGGIGGGGGSTGSNGTYNVGPYFSGAGGGGGFGGGGGGTNYAEFGARRYGGYGGFGGGGGSEALSAFGGGAGNGGKYNGISAFGGNATNGQRGNVPQGGGGAGMGGAVFNMFGTVTATDCTFFNNAATGGLVMAGLGSNKDKSLNAQGGSAFGGAIFNLDGTATLNDDTFDDFGVLGGDNFGGIGNAPSQAPQGAEVYNLAYGHLPGSTQLGTARLTLNNSLLVNAGFIDGSTALLANAFPNNDPRRVDSPPGDLTATATGVGNQIEGYADRGVDRTHYIGIDPHSFKVVSTEHVRFLGLGLHGGLTPTLAILPGEPIGRGNVITLLVQEASGNTALAHDQDGYPRTDAGRGDALDPGAYEIHTTATTSLVKSGGTTLIEVLSGKYKLSYGVANQKVLARVGVTNGDIPVDGGTATFTLLDGRGGTAGTVAGPVTKGVAVLTFTVPTALDAGTYTVMVNYRDPRGVYAPSGAKAAALTIAAQPTTIQAPDVQATYSNGAPLKVTLKATVAAAVAVNRGTMNFQIAGIGGATVGVANGAATVAFPFLAGVKPGRYAITASYSGGNVLLGTPADFLDSSATATLTINPAAPAVAVSPSSATVNFNPVAAQSRAFTATITTAGKPVGEGTVTVTFAGKTSAPLAVDAAGHAAFTLTIPANTPAGTAPFTVTYLPAGHGTAGTKYFTAATATGKVAVTADPTRLTLDAPAAATFNPAAQTVHLSAHVATQATLPGDPSGKPAPAGEGVVTFHAAAYSPTWVLFYKSLPIPATVDGRGVAAIDWTLPAGSRAGTYVVTAEYADGKNANSLTNFLSSVASSVNLTVKSRAAVVQVNDAHVTYGASNSAVATLIATVTSGGQPVAEGTVSFNVAGVGHVSGVVNARGVVVPSLQAPANGVPLSVPARTPANAFPITATYSDGNNPLGHVNYTGQATGAPVLHVDPQATTVSADLSPSPAFVSTNDKPIQVYAKVRGAIDTVDGGQVTFANPQLGSITVPLAAGAATGSLTLPANSSAGSYVVTATFTGKNNANGKPNFAAGTDTATLTVAVASTTINIGALSTGSVYLDAGTATEAKLAVGSSQQLTLPAGRHTLTDAFDTDAVAFQVNDAGTVSYDPSLEGSLAGAGTSTLAVHGATWTLDAHPLTTDRLMLGASAVSNGTPATFTSLPGSHRLSAADNTDAAVDFTVAADGTVGYVPDLDGVLVGRGTSTLTVSGVDVVIDATALSQTTLAIDGEAAVSSASEFTAVVLPGTHHLVQPGVSLAFTIDTDGDLDFDHALDRVFDPNSRGEFTLTVHGVDLTVDARNLTESDQTFAVSNYGSFSTANDVELRVLPGRLTFTAASLTFDFTVSVEDLVDFDTSLDDRVFGRDTDTLIAGVFQGQT